MTWFDRLVWNRAKARPPEQRSIDSVPWNVGPPLYPSGVTFDRAASFGAVFGAWRYLADQIATLPLHAYRDLGDRRQRLNTLPQLFQQPAVQGTLVDWLYRAVISMASRGNAVGLVMARDGFGFPVGVEWTNPDDWRVDDEPPEGSLAQPVWWYQGRRVLTEDVVHIPWFPVPGKIWGLSPMGAYAAVVQTALGAQQYSSDWFAAGGVPVGTYQNTALPTLDETTAQAAKARLVKAIRTHEPIVYGKDWKYDPPTSIAPAEAQFVESQRLGATQIAAIYGVPPEKIGGEAGGALTYNTVELNQISAQTDAVRPWVTKLEAKFFQLLPAPQYVRFGMDAVVRADTLTRHRVYEIDRKIGLRSIDELRALEDLEPLPGGEGADFTPLGKPAASEGDQGDEGTGGGDVIPLPQRK